MTDNTAPKRPRGRPRLHQSQSPVISQTPPKRGRPKKEVVPVPHVDLAPGQAKRLRKARRLRGLSYYELAKRSGIPYSTITNIEKGLLDRGTSTVNIMLLALVLEEDPGWLAFGTGQSLLADKKKQVGDVTEKAAW